MTVNNFQQANQLLREGKLEDAVAIYQKAIDQNPNFYLSHHNLGEVLWKFGRLEEAATAFQKAIELKPSAAWSYFNLAQVLEQLGREDEAIASYEKASELNPQLLSLRQQLEASLINDQPVIPDEDIALLYPPAEYQKLERTQLTIQPRNKPKLTDDVRLIAFYLPQYHPIPENDEWWGKGFTEWTNVTKAQPLFKGHYQPKLPADLGFYDLRLPEVRDAQARLAKKYGIYGFCYYYYWFAGKRLLERPLDEILQSKHPDFPFCLCWANENWTRRWDGLDNEILIAQEHSFENNQAFAESLVPFIKDERYIRVNGKPLVLIYRANILSDIEETVKLWREVWRENDIGEVYLCGCLGFGQQASEIISWGFDAGVQFPPHGMGFKSIDPATLGTNDYEGQIYDFRAIIENLLRNKLPSEREFFSVITSWDNTARRGKKSHILLHSNPEIYELWLRGVIEKTQQIYTGDEQLVFINAWNEWAEGTYLEPDIKYGHGYLSATSKVLNEAYSLQTAINLLRYLPIHTETHLHHLVKELQLRIELLQRGIELLIKEVEANENQIVYSLLITNICLKDNDKNRICFDTPLINTEVQQDQYLSISGWCFNIFGTKVTKLKICQPDHIVLANIRIKNDRPDIGQVFPECKQLDVGFADWIKAEDLLVVDKKDYKLEIYSFLENDEAIESAVIDISVKKEEFQRKLSGTIKTKIKWYYHQKKAVNGIIMELRQGKISTNIQNQSLLDELEEIVAQWQTMSSNLSGYLTSKNE